MPADQEKIMAETNSMSDIREAARRTPSLRDNIALSLQEPISLLGDVFSHLSLQGEPVKMSTAADGDIDELWQCIQEVDATLARYDTTQTKVKDTVIQRGIPMYV